MTVQLTAPIVVISTENTFLHLAPDLASLQDHMHSDVTRLRAKTSPTPDRPDLELEFFDGAGRVLRPVPSQGWIPTDLHVTDYTIAQDVLVRRMAEAVESAELHVHQVQIEAEEADDPLEQDRIRQRYTAPKAQESDTVLVYATSLLDSVAYHGEAGNKPIPENSGGWLHNAWHAAFG